MDRDKRWDRIQLAFDAMVEGKAEFSADTGEAGQRVTSSCGQTRCAGSVAAVRTSGALRRAAGDVG